ncbi:DUF481 domain-containing protein [Methylophaga sp.]|uniref:DUF481 domain-containing protein n=1 Tax=Methylophaga sp. TaxID=2024840 RepID=UPI003A9211F0
MSPIRYLLLAILLTPLVTHAAPSKIELINGDTLTADVVAETDDTLKLNHPLLGVMVIPRARIKSLVSSTDTTPTPPPPEKKPEVKHVEADRGLFGTGLYTNWKRRLDLGFGGTAGKSSTNQLNVGFNADYESKQMRTAHKTAFFRAESDHELSSQSFFTSMNRDWLRPNSPWFQFAGGRFDLDEFKDWDYRANASSGFGYEFVNTDSWLFVGRSGLGFNRTFGGEQQDFTPEGMLGIETKWSMNQYQHVEFSNTYYPSLNDRDYRNLTSFDWILDLNSFVGVALKLGITNEYDSTVHDDTEPNDFKYTVSLAWKL